MSYEAYRYIFLGGLIACGVFFVIAVILFFALKIPNVISYLSGRTARKGIESIRAQNEAPSDKLYQSGMGKQGYGKPAKRVSLSGTLIMKDAVPPKPGITAAESAFTAPAQKAGETDVLAPATGETAVLSPAAGETEVLAPAEQPTQAFTVEYEITFIHTNEVIA